jgi:hypothetical protein
LSDLEVGVSGLEVVWTGLGATGCGLGGAPGARKLFGSRATQLKPVVAQP